MGSFQQQRKKSQRIQRTTKYDSSKGKNKPTETVPDKYLLVDLLQKNSKATILKMVKELKEDLGKVKKTVYEQSGNINKEILKR